ncbi:DUF1330 domain-containing protein [Nocardia asteroides]|nr:DUF1330 domain-containing protein [Nocardia asteroides]
MADLRRAPPAYISKSVDKFPDMDRVRQWYDSPEYRQARQIREGKVRVQMLFAEGAPPKGFSLPA